MGAIGITVQCGALLLADGSEAGGQVVGDILVNHDRLSEVAPLVLKEASALFARGNFTNTVGFTIEHYYAAAASPLLAARARQFAPDLLPEKAALTLTFTDGVGSLTIGLDPALWKPLASRYGGVSIEIDYQVTGGRFTRSADPEAIIILDGNGDPDDIDESDILDGTPA